MHEGEEKIMAARRAEAPGNERAKKTGYESVIDAMQCDRQHLQQLRNAPFIAYSKQICFMIALLQRPRRRL